VYLGLAATKERLRSVRLDEFRYVLFATHAQIDEDSPMLSCIRLTPTAQDGGYLQAQEIFGMELDAEMVTLSACQSGLGRLASGEGIVGLAMAFFSAGARSLLTSLWKVMDESTALFVQRLHTYLRDGTLSRAEALQRAQWDMIEDRGTELRPDGEVAGWQDGKKVSDGPPPQSHHLILPSSRRHPAPVRRSYAHPYYWAFTLVGDWEATPEVEGSPAGNLPAASR
jgi:CHAT domain-containing protein